MAGTGSDRASRNNFDRTVRQPADLTQYRDLLTTAERKHLDAAGWHTPVWGIDPRKRGSGVADLSAGDQAWFHHAGYVRYIATITAVLGNRALDEALWPGSTYPATGFVFTLTGLADVHIAKTEINTLLGYKPRYTWQGNRLLDEDKSHLLAGLADDEIRPA